MQIVTARKVQQISEAKDPKKAIMDAVGDLSRVELCRDLVLVGRYISPDKVGSIYIPQQSIGEDEFQGRVGLILKIGPLAFKYDDYNGPDFQVGDWVVFGV
jgi:hypothetical protein